MTKSQRHGNRENKKPKQVKPLPPTAGDSPLGRVGLKVSTTSTRGRA